MGGRYAARQQGGEGADGSRAGLGHSSVARSPDQLQEAHSLQMPPASHASPGPSEWEYIVILQAAPPTTIMTIIMIMRKVLTLLVYKAVRAKLSQRWSQRNRFVGTLSSL